MAPADTGGVPPGPGPAPAAPAASPPASLTADLGPRAASAAVLIVIAGVVVWQGGWLLAGWLALVGGRMAFEWSRLVTGEAWTWLFALTAGGVAAAAPMVLLAGWPAALAVVALATACAAFAAVRRGCDPVWASLAVPVLGLPCAAFLVLSTLPPWENLTLMWMLVTVWSADTAALAAGRLVGGPRLWPSVSPKKTWAGFFGAMAAAALAAWVIALAVGAPAPGLVAGLGALAGLIGQSGDLAESALKRRFHVKDAGHIIPGHGGMLDRLDSLLAVTLATALCAALVPGGPLSVGAA